MTDPRIAPLVRLAAAFTQADRLPRLQKLTVRAARQGCYQLMRVGPAGVAGAGAMIAATAIFATALIAGHQAIKTLDLRIASAQQLHPVAVTPEQGLARLVTGLPTREQIPSVVEQILQQAHAAGVALDKGQYAYSPPKAGHVGRYALEFPVKSEYPSIRNFIDRTLTAVPAIALDKLRVERKVIAESEVNADIRFVLFVRE